MSHELTNYPNPALLANLEQTPLTYDAAKKPVAYTWVKDYRLTILYAVTTLVVIAIAAVIVNFVVGNLATKNLSTVVEEHASRDALHIESMINGQRSLIGLDLSETISDYLGGDDLELVLLHLTF